MRRKAVFAVLLLASTPSSYAVDCSVRLSSRSVTSGTSICLETGNYPSDTVLSQAAGNWNGACDSGNTTPYIAVGGCATAEIRVNVVYQSGISTSASGACGAFVPDGSGSMTGGTIRLYEYQVDSQGVVSACSGWAIDTLTHELGHALGLADVRDSACTSHIMGPFPSSGSRRIYSDDCTEVNRLWTTDSEQQTYCNMRCWTSCDNGVCPTEPITQLPTPCQFSPILLDLDGNGFHLAGLDAAVDFDIDADGTSNRISWTSAASGDAFLVFDRNGNGAIDDGRELFGTATLLAAGGTAPNGYEPLLELDDAAYGGNGDSLLDPADAAWELLQIWTDTDHDGVTDPHELASLDAAGVAQLDTRYKRANRRDGHGNGFRFRSTAMVRNPTGHIVPTITYDVFFVEAPSPPGMP